jgi:hypothetical protein
VGRWKGEGERGGREGEGRGRGGKEGEGGRTFVYRYDLSSELGVWWGRHCGVVKGLWVGWGEDGEDGGCYRRSMRRRGIIGMASVQVR